MAAVQNFLLFYFLKFCEKVEFGEAKEQKCYFILKKRGEERVIDFPNGFCPGRTPFHKIQKGQKGHTMKDINNLEWATSKENANYGTRNERISANLKQCL